MSVIQGGGFGSYDNYQLTNSVRLRASVSACFSKVVGAPSNNLKWMISIWIKRGIISNGYRPIMGCYVGAGNWFWLTIEAGDTLYHQNQYSGVSQGYGRISPKLRDPSAWYHVVYVYDSANATATLRARMYINSVEYTISGGIDVPLNQATQFNANGNTLYIGQDGQNGYMDGYLSDVHFIDGIVLTPSSFGEANSEGVWVPKAYSGGYGNNGFHLDFKDAALTVNSNVGLGKDVSGPGNYLPTTNISVTAGITYDSMVDTPTNNYATLNPLRVYSTSTPVDGALKGGATGGTLDGVCNWPITQKTYAEHTQGMAPSAAYPIIGLIDQSAATNQVVGRDPTYKNWAYQLGNGQVYKDAVAGSTYTTCALNDVIMIAYDPTTRRVWVGRNGTWFNSGDPDSGTGYLDTLTAETYFFASSHNGTAGSWNFGQRPFSYKSGTTYKNSTFTTLCTASLPVVSIPKPENYFDVKTRTGNGTAIGSGGQSVTSIAFQPDLVWIKGRSAATSHGIYDATRGATKDIGTDLATDQTTQTEGVTAFNSGGFTVGNLAKLNTNAATYIDCMWKESVVAGLDIVAVTGNGTNRTVAHNLNAVPKMIIGKSLTTAGADTGWPVYHASLANTEYLMLNTTAAKATGATYWNSTTPTTSVFSLGTAADVNTNTDTYIYYVFVEIAGYSKFGLYVGNGAVDGTFVYTGFRPCYVLVKSSTAVDDWRIYDSQRPGYNVLGGTLLADTAGAETTTAEIDFTANGFKARIATTPNAAQTYVYAAFAELPFGGSNIAPSPAR